MTIYENVARYARECGLSIDAVEKAAGLSNGTIGKWRIYTPRVDRLLKVAKVLNVDINDLIGGVSDAENVAAGEKR